nr:MAG TPA: hypothetical protein [Caudoviricetes sp.]
MYAVAGSRNGAGGVLGREFRRLQGGLIVGGILNIIP